MVRATVLAAIDGVGVIADVNMRMTEVRVQLVDDGRTHVNKVRLADVERPAGDVKHVQYLDRRQALQCNTKRSRSDQH